MQLRFAVALVVIVGAVFLLIALHRSFPVQPIQADLVIARQRSFISPKPAEQFVFVASALAAPLLAWLLTSWWHPKPGPILRSALAVAVPLGLLAPFVGSDATMVLSGQFEHLTHHLSISAVAALGAALAIGALLQSRRWLTQLPDALVWAAFLIAAALQVVAWRVISFASVTRSPVFAIHVDPVLYPLSQVVAGKTLLVDLPSQYGMFPELIAPLFRLVGLSVLTLSVLFGAMQFISVTALFAVLAKLIRSRFVLLATGLALLLVTFEMVMFFSGTEDRYFQYWPIRFFWPAMSVAAFHWFTCHRTLRRAAAMSSLSVVGLIWNVDSGLFISVAFLAYLVARGIAGFRTGRDDWSSRRYAAALALHAVVSAAGIGSFWAWLAVKSGGAPLNLFWLFGYQKIFYGLGFFLLPLPLFPHPWMSVLGVYLLAMIAALTAFGGRAPGRHADMLFYLSMLGLGLFVYYEGRSHVLNLVTVCWPAILIIGLATDGVLTAIRARRLPRLHLATSVAALTVLLFSAGSFLLRVPTLAKGTVHQIETSGVPADAVLQSELALIRRHTTPGQQCLILAQRQGIYSAEARLTSPIPGPGLIENLLQSEQDALVAAFLSGRTACVFYGLGPISDAELAIPIPAILRQYRIADRNTDDTMLYLVPKQ